MPVGNRDRHGLLLADFAPCVSGSYCRNSASARPDLQLHGVAENRPVALVLRRKAFFPSAFPSHNPALFRAQPASTARFTYRLEDEGHF